METFTKPTVDETAARASWQYSLRGLLVFMTIVSACLAVGVQFAGFMFALIVFGLIQASMLIFADWLIRPTHRRTLAFVTAASWTIIGCGLLLLGASAFVTLIVDGGLPLPVEGRAGMFVSTILPTGLIAAAICCYSMAVKRWHQLTARR